MTVDNHIFFGGGQAFLPLVVCHRQKTEVGAGSDAPTKTAEETKVFKTKTEILSLGFRTLTNLVTDNLVFNYLSKSQIEVLRSSHFVLHKIIY